LNLIFACENLEPKGFQAGASNSHIQEMIRSSSSSHMHSSIPLPNSNFNSTNNPNLNSQKEEKDSLERLKKAH